MTSSGFIDAGGAALTEGDLNGCVAIGFRRFDLRHAVVGHVDHGNRDRVPIIREDAHHSNLATEKAQAHCFLHSHLRLGGAVFRNSVDQKRVRSTKPKIIA